MKIFQLKGERATKRQIKREREKIFNEWQTIEQYFNEILFTYDWDSSDVLKQTPVFQNFNLIWMQFCEYWNTNEKHVLKVNPNAFHESFIKQ